MNNTIKNTMPRRLFTEKLPAFQTEARNLRAELNRVLELGIKRLRIINVYDVFDCSEELLQQSLYRVFAEAAADRIAADAAAMQIDGDSPHFAMEYLPGQYDQRAAAAQDCLRLLEPSTKAVVRSARLLVFDDGIAPKDIERIKKYLINPVEMRRKDMSTLQQWEQAQVKPTGILQGFTEMADDHLAAFCKQHNLAMSAADLQCVIAYFTKEGRNPSDTELRILDTYWSDHCRHTTFNTQIAKVDCPRHFMQQEYDDARALYLKMTQEVGEPPRLTLMRLATLGLRWLRGQNLAADVETSEETNACSIFVDVENGGAAEKWLLQFKNETHNHPTEIEPYGGASTCLGGAIRDPLSGRAYVYQAMRVTGAANIYTPISETMAGKLPQRLISTKAAQGCSAYGNQVGVATTHVREIYHPGYLAKRMEVGAVVGAVRAADIKRERPAPGDPIFLIGGRTGRDGIGGATGSSKKHTTQNLAHCGSEVQKGNAPQERKLLRLFRRPEVTTIIKKCNDFGAGGVAVAVGELADGVDIYLDRIPVKYDGLNAAELAISESQERMAVVVAPDDAEQFCAYCHEENIEATRLAEVTPLGRMRMFYGNEMVADLERSFIDSAGAQRSAAAVLPIVKEENPFVRKLGGASLKEKLLANLADDNVLSQKGMVEMFDSTIGAGTVLMPYGGATQRTETQVSAQKICAALGVISAT